MLCSTVWPHRAALFVCFGLLFYQTAKKEALRVYEATMHDRVKAIAQKATSASQSSEPEPEERVLEDTTGGFPENDGTVVEEHSLWEIHREARKAALEVFRQDAVQVCRRVNPPACTVGRRH